MYPKSPATEVPFVFPYVVTQEESDEDSLL